MMVLYSEVTIPIATSLQKVFYLWRSDRATDRVVLILTGGIAREDYVNCYSYDTERNSLRDTFIADLVRNGFDVLCIAHEAYPPYGAGWGDYFIYYVGKWLKTKGYVHRHLFGYSAGGVVALHKAIYPGNAPEFTRLGDVNMDGVIDILDAIRISSAYGSYPGHPKWDPKCDLNGDGKVDKLDAIIVSKNFGLEAPKWESAVVCSVPCDWDSHLSYGSAPSAEIFQTAHLAANSKIPTRFIAPVRDFTAVQMKSYYERVKIVKSLIPWNSGHDCFGYKELVYPYRTLQQVTIDWFTSKFSAQAFMANVIREKWYPGKIIDTILTTATAGFFVRQEVSE